ncbi:MAG: hypothetical protein U0359_06155 [Byssovorax sp.]
MTSSVLLFDGYIPGDEALKNSHWIAERTHDRLGGDAALLTHPNAVRKSLETSLADPEYQGLVLFGHGDPGRLHAALRVQHKENASGALDDASEAGAVYGCDEQPALDLDNLHLLRDRWCHALACNIGLSLAHRAVGSGTCCFVAYQTSLTPEYEVDSLPVPLRSLLESVVTSTTYHLHAGIREEITLKAKVQEAIEALEIWLEDKDGLCWIEAQEGFMQVAGLRGLVRQLRRDMVVVVAER